MSSPYSQRTRQSRDWRAFGGIGLGEVPGKVKNGVKLIFAVRSGAASAKGFIVKYLASFCRSVASDIRVFLSLGHFLKSAPVLQVLRRLGKMFEV